MITSPTGTCCCRLFQVSNREGKGFQYRLVWLNTRLTGLTLQSSVCTVVCGKNDYGLVCSIDLRWLRRKVFTYRNARFKLFERSCFPLVHTASHNHRNSWLLGCGCRLVFVVQVSGDHNTNDCARLINLPITNSPFWFYEIAVWRKTQRCLIGFVCIACERKTSHRSFANGSLRRWLVLKIVVVRGISKISFYIVLISRFSMPLDCLSIIPWHTQTWTANLRVDKAKIGGLPMPLDCFSMLKHFGTRLNWA